MSYKYGTDKWALYESNVQAYRSNFLSSQSLLIMAGAIMLEKNNFVFFSIAIIAIFQMWYIWFRLIIARTYIVDFHKFGLYKYFDDSGKIVKDEADNKNPLSEKTYASNRKTRLLVNKTIPEIEQIRDYHSPGKKFKNIRLTRFKIDVLVPISLTLIWVAFIGDLIFKSLVII